MVSDYGIGAECSANYEKSSLAFCLKCDTLSVGRALLLLVNIDPTRVVLINEGNNLLKCESADDFGVKNAAFLDWPVDSFDTPVRLPGFEGRFDAVRLSKIFKSFIDGEIGQEQALAQYLTEDESESGGGRDYRFHTYWKEAADLGFGKYLPNVEQPLLSKWVAALFETRFGTALLSRYEMARAIHRSRLPLFKLAIPEQLVQEIKRKKFRLMVANVELIHIYALWSNSVFENEVQNMVEQGKVPIPFLVDWAVSKGVKVAWIPWAIEKGLVNVSQELLPEESGHDAGLQALADKIAADRIASTGKSPQKSAVANEISRTQKLGISATTIERRIKKTWK